MTRHSKSENFSLTTNTKTCRQDYDLPQNKIKDQLPSWGTFRPNKNEPVHKWYPYLEGYSRQLVERELHGRRRGDVVYDPFAGSGTTLLTALSSGLNGYYSEINPVMQFVASTKLRATQEGLNGTLNLAALKMWRNRVAHANGSDFTVSSTETLGDFDRFFDRNALGGIHFLRRCIKQEPEQMTRDLLKIALAAVVVPVSLMVRRGDLRFATQKERAKAVLPFKETLTKKLDEIIQDIDSMPSVSFGNHAFVSADVRDSTLNNTADVVVTSPPYLNGTNYFRNTKLEMRVLDFIEYEKQLSRFYQQGITAGINNVSSRRSYPTVPNDNVAELVAKLEQQSYDTRIPIMVSGYFSDMQDAVHKIHEALKPGGILSFDIGDSQFAGVHVPTHDLLDEIIKSVGFKRLGETLLRARASKNGMKLTQRVMRYERV